MRFLRFWGMILVFVPLTAFTGYVQSADPAGHIAHWRGENNAVDRLENNNGTLHGDVTFAPAVSGYGFRFGGAGEGAVNIPDAPFLGELTGSLTIALWVHIEKLPDGVAMLVFRGDDRGGLDPFVLNVDNNSRLNFGITNEANRGAAISAPIAAGRFVFVVATLDNRTGVMRLYENGRLSAQTTAGDIRPLGQLDANANPGLALGNHASQGRSGFHYPFTGILDDVRIYNRALPAREVSSLYERYNIAPVVPNDG